jgi:hypothetical protein
LPTPQPLKIMMEYLGYWYTYCLNLPYPPLRNQHPLMKLNSLLFSALLLTAATANAELITGTTIESSTVGLNDQMAAEKAINGFGLDGDVPSLTGSHRQGFDTNWWSGWSGDITEWQITVDLEGNYDLDLIHVWNYREGCCSSRGLKEVEIYVSPDEDEANLVKLTTNGTGMHDNAGNFVFPQASTDEEDLGFDLDLSGVTNSSLLANARLIRLDGGSSLHEGSEIHGGLAEIQFSGIPAVAGPEFLVLQITPNGTNFDFSWESTGGKVYDLVSSTDLSTPVIEWLVYGENTNIPGVFPTTTLTNIEPDGTLRFFALIEKNGD